MYRVVTKYRNGSARPVIEHGPWHPTLPAAERWADTLREHGYDAHVENQNSQIRGSNIGGDDNADLAAALGNMA